MKVRRVKKNGVLVSVTVLEFVVIGLTMWFVDLAYQQRGYLAYGGEWGLLVLYNLSVYFLYSWLNEVGWVIRVKKRTK